MTLKVLAFSNLFPRPWEPQRATFNRQQLERLAQHCDLQVLVPISWLDWLKARRQGLDTKTKVSTLPTRYFSYFYIPKVCRWSYGFTLFLSTLQVIKHFIGPNRPDIIYTPWAYPDGLVTVLLGKLLRIPVVVKLLGTDINEFPKIPGVGLQIRWVLKHAAAVIPVSQDLAKKVIAMGADPANTQVIYDGVDPSRFAVRETAVCRQELDLQTQGKVIVYVGNLLSTKGCLDLVHSFAAVLQSLPDAQLVYVGKGEPCAGQIVELAQQLGINDNIRLVGTQPHEKVGLWMGAADVIVLPSYNEGVPNVLLEAMSCGRPVVATQVGGIPEVVPDYAGILVPPAQPQQFADALLQALSQNWDTDKILAHIRTFTWERNINALYSILTAKVQG